MRAKPIQNEAIQQRALILWAAHASRQRPELECLFAIPNGGNRDARTGALMKAEGVKAGVPDLYLAVPRSDFNGLFIEMKSLTGRVSPAQKEWIVRLQQQGYAVEVCHGWDEARAIITAYLDGRYEQE